MPSLKILFQFVWMAFSIGLASAKPDDLGKLRTVFLQAEINREAYLDRLVALRYNDVWNGGNKGNSILDEKIAAIDDELKKHLLPANSSSQSLTRLRVGKWESPRHPYLYCSDHTWKMLPMEKGDPHGLWRIQTNRYYDWAPSYSSKKLSYFIILLDDQYFVFTDGKQVFCEKRIN